MLKLAKITPPNVLNPVPRQHLIELIDTAPERIVWVSAPAGAGKTTLAAVYAASRQETCLWYQIDGGDTDMATLVYYMGLALKQAKPRLRHALPLLTPEYRGCLALFTRRYFEKLFSLLCQNKPGSGLLVLDDYHYLRDEALHDLIRIGLSVAHERSNVLVLSRHAPPPCFSGLRASGKMAVLGWDEMRFRLDETRAFLNLSPRRRSVPEETVRLIHQQTDGWAAGMRLLGETLNHSLDVQNFATLGHEVIFDFFLKELFEQIPRQTQDFLLQVAFLPGMTASMARALTGMVDTAELLQRMSAQNFFITRHSGVDPTYTFHRMFRDFLLNHGRKVIDQVQLNLLRRQAAELLRGIEKPEDAAKLYIMGEDWDHLGDLLQELAPALLMQGRQQTLDHWLGKIPEGLLRARPWLCFWKAMAVMPWNIREGRRFLATAIEGFTRQHEPRGNHLAHAEMIMAIFLELGDFSRMEPFFLHLDTTLGDDASFPDPDVEARVVMSMVLGCIFCRPDHPRRQTWIQRGEELLHASIPISQKISLGFHLLIFHIYMGNIQQASRIRAKAKSLAGFKELPDLSRLLWLVLEATHAHLVQPHSEHCRDIIDQALYLAEKTGIHAFDVLLLLIAGYTAVNRGDRDELSRLKQRLEPLIPTANSFDLGNYHCLLACEQLSKGNGPKALSQAQLALDAIPAPGSPFPTILGLLGLAEAAIESDNWPLARSFLTRARRKTSRIPGYAGDVLFLFPTAYAAFRRGKSKVGMRVLKRALFLTRVQGWRNSVFWRPNQLAMLCSKALEAGVEEVQARMLIQDHDLWDRIAPISHNRPQYPLTISTFGSLSVVRHGVLISSPRTFAHKPLALLKAMIVFGGRNVDRAVLKNLLWPDADGDRANLSLKFALHTLRKFLDIPGAVTVKGKTLSLDPSICWVDLMMFERACAVVDNAAKQGARDEELIEHCEHALALYQGDFLAQDPADWITATRERLRTRCMMIYGRLARIHEQMGKPDLALATCEGALALDPLREEFYDHMISLYLQAGQENTARIVAKRCLKIFQAELGTKPGETILNLANASPESSVPDFN